jgi:putative two-component system response regulator
MRVHPLDGEKICGSLRSVAQYLPIIRHHHERWDGQGYPDHFYRAEIPIGARIAAIADSWDAMVSTRPYREALSLDEARQRLADGAGTQWEPGLVEIFTGLLDGGLMRQIDPMQIAS